jgi:hypothetical protein
MNSRLQYFHVRCSRLPLSSNAGMIPLKRKPEQRLPTICALPPTLEEKQFLSVASFESASHTSAVRPNAKRLQTAVKPPSNCGQTAFKLHARRMQNASKKHPYRQFSDRLWHFHFRCIGNGNLVAAFHQEKLLIADLGTPQ